MKRKKTTVTSLKKKYWKLFSYYIRLRDCLKSTKTDYQGNCCTCGRLYDLKNLQAGHFISTVKTAIKYDYRNVHAQCYHCNIMRKGAWEDYYEFMKYEYGQEVIDELLAKRNDIKQFKVFELEEMIEQIKLDILSLNK